MKCPACHQDCAWVRFWMKLFADQDFTTWDKYREWMLKEIKK